MSSGIAYTTLMRTQKTIAICNWITTMPSKDLGSDYIGFTIFKFLFLPTINVQ